MRVEATGREIVEAKDAICLHGYEYNFRTPVKRLLGEGIGWFAEDYNRPRVLVAESNTYLGPRHR